MFGGWVVFIGLNILLTVASRCEEIPPLLTHLQQKIEIHKVIVKLSTEDGITSTAVTGRLETRLMGEKNGIAVI